MNSIETLIKNMQRTESSTTHKMNTRILHGILGVADEAGELVKIAKSAIYYGDQVDVVNLKEEVGDMLWYLALIIDELAVLSDLSPDTVFDQIVEQNRVKLATRYPEEYSDSRAVDRDTSEERKTMENH